MTNINQAKNRSSCSCMMIVRDAEDTIFDCLDSIFIAGCFDQIIIIQDTRTSDRTPEIIYYMRESHPEITYGWHKWVNYDFSEARNKALSLVKAKYGFWMDSDDILIDGGGVRNILKNPGNNSYLFQVLCPDPGWKSESNVEFPVVEHLRLFPIIPGLKWELPVHEQIAFALREAKIPEISTPYRILHIGYLKKQDVAQKHERNFQIMQKWLSQHPEDTPQTRYLSERYQDSLRYFNSKGDNLANI